MARQAAFALDSNDSLYNVAHGSYSDNDNDGDNESNFHLTQQGREKQFEFSDGSAAADLDLFNQMTNDSNVYDLDYIFNHLAGTQFNVHHLSIVFVCILINISYSWKNLGVIFFHRIILDINCDDPKLHQAQLDYIRQYYDNNSMSYDVNADSFGKIRFINPFHSRALNIAMDYFLYCDNGQYVTLASSATFLGQ